MRCWRRFGPWCIIWDVERPDKSSLHPPVGSLLIVALLAGLVPALRGSTGEPGMLPQVRQSSADAREWIQLFNGRDLADWTIKFAKHDLGENFRNTFRVEDGLLKAAHSPLHEFDIADL